MKTVKRIKETLPVFPSHRIIIRKIINRLPKSNKPGLSLQKNNQISFNKISLTPKLTPKLSKLCDKKILYALRIEWHENGQIKSGREDLNFRPHGPEPCALPDCATPRNFICYYNMFVKIPLFIGNNF